MAQVFPTGINIGFPLNIEADAPADGRLYVESKADLIDSTVMTYIHSGMKVMILSGAGNANNLEEYKYIGEVGDTLVYDDWEFQVSGNLKVPSFALITNVPESVRELGTSVVVQVYGDANEAVIATYQSSNVTDTEWAKEENWNFEVQADGIVEIYPDSIIPATMTILRDATNWVGYNDVFTYATSTPAELGLVPAMRIFDGAYLYEVTNSTIQRVHSHKPIAKTLIAIETQFTPQVDPYEVTLDADCGVVIITHIDGVASSTNYYPSIEITLPASADAVYYDIRVIYLSTVNAATTVKLIAANNTVTTDTIDGLSEKTLTVGDRYILIADGEVDGDITTK